MPRACRPTRLSSNSDRQNIVTQMLIAPRRKDTARGVGFLLLGLSIFSMQDVFLKQLSGAYPLPEAMLIRSLTAMPLMVLIVRQTCGLAGLASPRWRALTARGLIMCMAYFSYYLALANLSLSTTAALYFTSPLFIILFSTIFLGEKASPRRLFAVVFGFAGVLIIMRPGTTSFDWALLLAVFSGLAYGLSMVSARHLGDSEDAAVMAFYGNTIFLVVAVILSLVFGTGQFAEDGHKSIAFLTRAWVSPTLPDLARMVACGFIAAFGLTFLTQAYRIAEANVVAPFEYVAIVWSLLFGWLFWGDLPDPQSWVGIAMIIAAGLMVLSY